MEIILIALWGFSRASLCELARGGWKGPRRRAFPDSYLISLLFLVVYFPPGERLFSEEFSMESVAEKENKENRERSRCIAVARVEAFTGEAQAEGDSVSPTETVYFDSIVIFTCN